jgi:hypothetical protein
MYGLDAAMHLKLVLNSVLAVAGSDVGHATAGLRVESGPAQDHQSVRGRGGSGIEAESGPTQNHNSVRDGGGSVEHETKDEPAQELKSVRDGGGLAVEQHKSFEGKAVGEIHSRAEFWKRSFVLDSFVAGILKEGYKVPVKDGFPDEPYEEDDNKSARDNYDFVRNEVRKLVEKGRVIKAKTKPACVNPLTVASKKLEDGTLKLRLVLDLSRKVNLAVEPDPFKMITMKDVLEVTEQGCYQLVFDFQAAFHHVALHPDSYPLFGFKVIWKDGEVAYYYYVVLAFGYRRATQVLGRVIKPILGALTAQGIDCLVFVDDGRVTGESKEIAARKYQTTLDLFQGAGFVIAWGKSHRPEEASRRVRYLGLIIDSEQMRVWVPQGKMCAAKAALTGLAGSRRHKVKKVSSVIGQVGALEPALGSAVRVGLRIVLIQVTECSDRYGWTGTLYLSEDSIRCLKAVAERLDEWDGYPIRNKATAITLASVLAGENDEDLARKIPNRPIRGRHFTMVSDASVDKVAAYGLGEMPDFVHVEGLKEHELAWSSSRRELAAIEKTLFTRSRDLRRDTQTTIWWITDSANLTKYLVKGSGRIEIMEQILKVLEKARELHLDICPVWVSRDDPRLQRADGLTKSVNTDEWAISQSAFEQTQLEYGQQFTADLFATEENAKCDRFFTYSFCKGAAGTDAFARSWDSECAYVAPPVSLVVRVIKKISMTKMSGVLLIPLWKGARFWTKAFPDGAHLASIFSGFETRRLHTSAWDTSKKDMLGGRNVNFLILGIESDGRGVIQESISGRRCFRRRVAGTECDHC